MRVGKALAAKIRHRVGLAPDNVVKHPEAEVLQRRTHPENIVIAADYPQGAGILEKTLRGAQPGDGEAVIFGKAREPVPFFLDAVDARIVRAVQFAGKLEIVGRVGEDHIDRGLWQRIHDLDAAAGHNCVAFHPGPL
jgi:hypothetical protein